MLPRDVDQDGGAGRAAFVILLQPTARARSDGIWDPKGRDAGRTADLSVHVLRDSISDPRAAAAGRTECVELGFAALPNDLRNQGVIRKGAAFFSRDKHECVCAEIMRKIET
jgi:hypothetical protein